MKGVRALYGGYTIEELRKALEVARAHERLSIIHVPVYRGNNELGDMGVFGDWNVGNWCARMQEEYHRLCVFSKVRWFYCRQQKRCFFVVSIFFEMQIGNSAEPNECDVEFLHVGPPLGAV